MGWIGYKIFKSSMNESLAQLNRKLVYLFILFVLVAFLVSLSIVSLGSYVFYLTGGFETESFIRHLLRVEFPGAIRQLSVWILIVSVLLIYAIWSKTIERERQLQEENLKYRYRTLKTQLNPHFLFNSLNTLSEIVYTDVKKTDTYIHKLSKIYRYILDNEEIDLIPLDQEIEFVGQYLDLQKERYESKIQLDIDFENADKFKIVPISLQLLVENALKHNAISKDKPLKIHIYGGDGYISISNNVQRKNRLPNSPGIGLPNLKERVRAITAREVIISQEDNKFVAKLPLVDV